MHTQVDYKKVGWGTEALGRCEYKKYAAITDGWDETQDNHDETKDRMPQWVHWWKLIPMGIDKVQHIWWDSVHNRKVASGMTVAWCQSFKMWLN